MFLCFQAEALKMTQLEEDGDDIERKSEKESDEEYKIENEDMIDEMEEEQSTVAKKLLARKKHRKLNSLDISSEDDPDSDEDFKGSSSDDEEDFDDHTSSDDSTFANMKRRGRKGDARPVRRSTRARMTRGYDDDFSELLHQMKNYLLSLNINVLYVTNIYVFDKIIFKKLF